jgi:hypothetical protein
MREWNLVIAPVALIVYFIAFPAQFSALIAWAQRFVY